MAVSSAVPSVSRIIIAAGVAVGHRRPPANPVIAIAIVSIRIGHPSAGSTTRCRTIAAHALTTTIGFDARSTSETAPGASELMMLVPAARAAGAVAALVVGDFPERDEVVPRQPEPRVRVDDARLEHAFRHLSNPAARGDERCGGRGCGARRAVVAQRHVLPVRGDVAGELPDGGVGGVVE